jgi:uncharacterized protein YjbI with pentapeptide repeats
MHRSHPSPISKAAVRFGAASVLAASLLLAPSTARAWGPFVHTTIGEMAQEKLSPNGLKLVQSVLDPSFSGSLGGQACNWADTWRSTHSSTAPWHFVDMMKAPPQVCGYVPTDCASGDCIIAALTTQIQTLLSTSCAPSTANTQALQFIAHFIGDITQPLHVVNRDVGGNSDTVTYDGAATNFHAIHDVQIPVQYASEVGAGSDAASFAAYLTNQYGQNAATYTSSTFVDLQTVDSSGMLVAAIAMANDANALDCSQSAFWTLYDQNPSQDFSGSYYQATKSFVAEQIAKAGFRLAAYVNAIADECYGADYAGQNFTGQNLSGRSFANANLTGAILTRTNLAGADFAGANLTGVVSGGITGTPSALPMGWTLVDGYLLGPGANLASASLASANLANADLAGADLAGATLTGANLTDAALANANLTGAKLASANVTGATFAGATLAQVASGALKGAPAALPARWSIVDGYLVGAGANLASASLGKAKLAGADLAGANLSGAVLSGATLTGAVLTGADVAGARFDAAAMKGVVSGGVPGAPAKMPASFELVDGYFVGPGANLARASLAGANLFGLNLSSATLASANLSNSNLSRVNLDGANLTSATLTGATLTRVRTTATTTCVDGTKGPCKSATQLP